MVEMVEMTKVKMPWIERAKFGIFVILVAAVFFATLICVWILLVRFAVPAIDRLGWSGAVQFFINNAWQRFYALPLSSHVYVAGTFLGGTILFRASRFGGRLRRHVQEPSGDQEGNTRRVRRAP